jgi:hypothetical protein
MGALALGGLVVAAPPAAAADDHVLSVCLTITPKSVVVQINDTTVIGTPTVEQPRTCIVL